MRTDIAITSILVGTGDAIAAAGLKTLLKEELDVSAVKSAPNLAKVLATLSDMESGGIAVLASELLGPDLVGTVQLLKAKYPKGKIVVLLPVPSRPTILALLGAGVHGCIPRNVPTTELISALRRVAEGQVYVPQALCEISTVLDASKPTQNGPHLTERQRAVLDLVAAGRSNKQIARDLGIAEGTVKVHVNSVFHALNVHNRVSAAAAYRGYAVKMDKVSPELFDFESSHAT